MFNNFFWKKTKKMLFWIKIKKKRLIWDYLIRFYLGLIEFKQFHSQRRLEIDLMKATFWVNELLDKQNACPNGLETWLPAHAVVCLWVLPGRSPCLFQKIISTPIILVGWAFYEFQLDSFHAAPDMHSSHHLIIFNKLKPFDAA